MSTLTKINYDEKYDEKPRVSVSGNGGRDWAEVGVDFPDVEHATLAAEALEYYSTPHVVDGERVDSAEELGLRGVDMAAPDGDDVEERVIDALANVLHFYGSLAEKSYTVEGIAALAIGLNRHRAGAPA